MKSITPQMFNIQRTWERKKGQFTDEKKVIKYNTAINAKLAKSRITTFKTRESF